MTTMASPVAQNQSSSAASRHAELVGWTPESSGRGTLTLIFTCLFTIFLCTWVVIHPRIHGSKNMRLLHKVALSLKTVIAPELIAIESAQEWMQARRMVRDCASSTNGSLTLVHAFYVGMLGVRYRCQQGTKVLWPNQLVWLLGQGLIDWKQLCNSGLTLEDLKDRSNADSATKFFAMTQVAWFVAQSIMRVVHNLPLAPLESMTLGYIPLFAVTYFFWWTKPKDIETSTTIDFRASSRIPLRKLESMSLSKHFDDNGKPYPIISIWRLTPRVFEQEAKDRTLRQFDEKAWTQYSQLDMLPNYHGEGDLARTKAQSMPAAEEIVLAHWDPDIYHSKFWPLTCLFGISFGALHLASWDSTFPTITEMWLWRGAAIGSMVTMLIFMHFEKVVLSWRDPLMSIKILSPALYLASRMIMLGEAFAVLRASDPAVYNTYVASSYWLHFA